MIQVGVHVKLSESEVLVATVIGKERNRLSLQTKVNRRRDPNQTDEEMNVEATGAELAVAKYLNVYPDLAAKSGQLPQFDLHFNNRNIEVKRNHKLDGDLLVPNLNLQSLYILVCGSLPDYHLVGSIEGIEILWLGEWIDLTYGTCWRVNPKHLSPLGSTTEVRVNG